MKLNHTTHMCIPVFDVIERMVRGPLKKHEKEHKQISVYQSVGHFWYTTAMKGLNHNQRDAVSKLDLVHV